MNKHLSPYPQLNDKDWLIQKYIKEEKSQNEISKIINCGKGAIKTALNRHNVKIRSRKDAQFTHFKREQPKISELNNKEWLQTKYIDEKLSISEIANLLGLNKGRVFNALKRYNIPRRNKTEAAKLWHPKHVIKPDTLGNKEWLYDKYVIQKMSLPQIGKLVNVATTTVYTYLKRFNIPIRTIKESHNLKDENGNELYYSEEAKIKRREGLNNPEIYKSPTRPELIFDEICKKNNIPLMFCGDRRVWVGHRNPDFISYNGKKLIVEIFGNYWHSPLQNRNMENRQSYQATIDYYKKYNYKCQIFWEKDLLRDDAEQFILSQIDIKPITKG